MMSDKSQMMKLVLISMFVVLSGSVFAEEAPLIPMRDFFKNPPNTGYDLSPNGKTLSLLKPWKNRLNIHVQKIGEPEAQRVTSSEARDIMMYFWANDERLVYIQDKGGDENYLLYAVDADGENAKCLTPFDGVRVRIIDDLEDDPKHMIIGHNKRNKEVFDAYRINIDSGEMSLVVKNPGNFTSYVTDNAGKLRIATSADGVNTSLYYRETEESEFRKILTTNFRESMSPLFFTFDDQKIYASSNLGRDKSAIVLFDPATGKEEKVIYEHPEVDVSQLIRSKKRQKITGVSYYTSKRGYAFFDPWRKEFQAFIEKQFPGLEVSLIAHNRAETKWLARTFSDRSKGSYYFVDSDARTVKKLADISPWLKPEQMSEMKPIEYTSRDGLKIQGYLTLPEGKDPKNLPVVINPHGGPWARDRWGFRPEVQFLANRGYAVLQMNFRGSTGFGRSFWEASFKEWGRKMQDDISDGVKWLIDEGIADPDRIGIYGASYGGYATLAGMTFTPHLYACGVDYVGVSNLLTFMKTVPPYWKDFLEMMYEMVGNPETETEILKEASPVFHVDKIQAPLFIAQGANDPRVVKAESDQMVEALKKRGIEVPYMVKEDEGHGFHNEENRFEFYRAMEQFLAKHLGGRQEDADLVLPR